jgi:uncharacterized membrane protein YphA (DoxX/SURF4 family)
MNQISLTFSFGMISIPFPTLLTYIGIAAVFLTLFIAFGLKKHKEILMTLFQNFCGLLFVVSGAVKAVDPLGTGYKMVDYFTEFESTFTGTAMEFIAPMFPFLSQYSTSFSVFVIVLEIILGIMLITGSKSKLVAWLFFLLVAFFTVLTGFTYLTGYVPSGVNFFEFSNWGPYVKSNMKVTDCGCFGDFIKLEPKTSFLKDVFLLIPAIYFIVRNRKMHQLFGSTTNTIIETVSIIGLLFYCLSNFVWDIPSVDFRPFARGKDVAKTKQIEEQAMADVQITGWKLKNKTDGKEITLANSEYMTNFKKYPKTEWSVVDQIKTEPLVKATKISEFEILDMESNDITDDFLGEGSRFLIVSYKLYVDIGTEKQMFQDSIFTMDTTIVNRDTLTAKVFDRVEEKQKTVPTFSWDRAFSRNVRDELLPTMRAITAKGIPVTWVVGGSGNTEIEALVRDMNIQNIRMAQADDILLKTIVRSNPGVVLWKNGKIVDKWHIDKLPSGEELLKEYF